jgi:hypothetical protein
VEQTSEGDLRGALARVGDGHGGDPAELAGHIGDKTIAKFDRYLDEDLLCRNYASRMLDFEALRS